MKKDKNFVINQFEPCIFNEANESYNNFYVGITDDVQRRLKEHNVTNEKYCSEKCEDHETARAVEKHYIEKGTKGGDGGGDETTIYAYVYKISPSTNENA